MAQKIKALIEGGNASAGPPLGPQLGPLGVNIGSVVSSINEETKEFEGMEVPVTVVVDDESKDFEIEVGTPPTSAMIKEEVNLDKLSPHPEKEKVANMLIEQCIKIAKAKMPDLNAPHMKSAVKQIVGACLTSGVLVEDKDPRKVVKEIDKGKYDEEIKNEKTELTEEEKEELRKEKEKMKEKMEEMEEEWKEKAEEMIKKMEGEEEEYSRDDMVEKLKAEDIPYEIIEELLPEEEGEEESEEETEATEEVEEEEA